MYLHSLKLFLILTIISLSFTSFSEEVKEEEKKEVSLFDKTWYVSGHIALNAMVASEHKRGAGLSLGGVFSYYFVPYIGVFFGTDYVQKNISGYERLSYVKSDIKSTYLDIPFGFTFRQKNPFKKSHLFIFTLGLYYALGLNGKIKYERGVNTTTERMTEKDYIGFIFTQEYYFPIYSHFKMGIFFGLKVGFLRNAQVFKNYDTNYIYSGLLGMSFKY